MKIGFIGLGLMGTGMALNLRKAGHDLVVHDLNRDRATAHLEAGATWAASVAEVGRLADVVFTSVPGPKEMQAVGLGPEGLLAHLRSGSVWFDLTTNSPTVVRDVARQGLDKGILVMDAPVSGGPEGARTGKLAIYVGGDRATFDRYKPLLDAIGDQVLYVGATGAGNTAKIVHNGASLIVKAGVEPLELWHAIRQGAIGRARTFDRMTEYLQSKYEPASFALKLAHKDLTLALDLGQELGVPMKLGAVVDEDFREAIARGWGERDSRSPMQLQNERAGVTLQCSAEDVKKTLARS